ncbi:MAG TPA: M17 family peptidase N-terminal domain-containing protein, partial [Alphaproteobacteria bacterium]|nr:M17 family peptidase N-terminal domain-containing protein [Alphaproteobacteria bacterium]
MLKIAFAPPAPPAQNALILTVTSGRKLGAQSAKLDHKLGGVIRRALAASHFTGKKEQTLTIMAPAKSRLTRIVLAGLGEPGKIDAVTMQRAGGAALAALGNKETRATFLVDEHKGAALDTAEMAANAALGARLRSYRFDKYRTKLKPDQKPALRTLTMATGDAAGARRVYASLDKIADGVFFARDLVSEPPNLLYPETLAAACLELKRLGVKVEVLDEKQMTRMGMGA